MSLIEIKGNLFDVPGLTAYAHGVNCIGEMGAGIAVPFRKRWPVMYARYRAACAAGLRPGDCLPCPETGPTWVYCLATQPRPGRCAALNYVERAVDKMIAHAVARGITRIGMPRIGCGYGGLAYRDVRPILSLAGDFVSILVADKDCHPQDTL